jgi:hypothetical protein
MQKKLRRLREVVKREITEEQFMNILERVCQPVQDESKSDLKEGQPSAIHQSDGCSEMHTHSNKTVNT